MDRKAWIAITLSVLALVAWFYYFGILHPSVPVRHVITASTPVPAATIAPAAPTAASSSTASSSSSSSTIAPQSATLSGGSVDYLFVNDTGGIRQATLSQHTGENGKPVVLDGNLALPIGAIGAEPGEVLSGFAMTTNPSTGDATFTRHDAGWEITKRFVVPPADAPKEAFYQVKMEVAFHNTGAAAATYPNYFVSAGGATPVHSNDFSYNTRFDWMDAGKLQLIDVNWFSASSFLGLFATKPARSLYQQSSAHVPWVAVSSQYFCSIVAASGDGGTGAWAQRYDTQRLNNNQPVYGMEGGLGMPGFTVAPGATVTKSFTIYAGPKELGYLESLPGGEGSLLNFNMFGIININWITEGLLWAMNLLHGWLFGSYAAAIIALTLIIKSCLWPLQNRATTEMRRMSVLSPKITELKAKYQDDPQKMQEETMRLYREYGVNPISGCLPMLLQIPIFFGFYSMLGSAVELRNSSFLWVHDLSQPDTAFHLLGFPINILPLVMAATMVWQMVISPKSGDPMQQRMMYFTPIIFVVISYNYASGLALYWTTQNIFSIVQLYLTRNKPLPTLEKKSVAAKREAIAQKKKKKRPGQ